MLSLLEYQKLTCKRQTLYKVFSSNGDITVTYFFTVMIAFNRHASIFGMHGMNFASMHIQYAEWQARL